MFGFEYPLFNGVVDVRMLFPGYVVVLNKTLRLLLR